MNQRWRLRVLPLPALLLTFALNGCGGGSNAGTDGLAQTENSALLTQSSNSDASRQGAAEDGGARPDGGGGSSGPGRPGDCESLKGRVSELRPGEGFTLLPPPNREGVPPITVVLTADTTITAKSAPSGETTAAAAVPATLQDGQVVMVQGTLNSEQKTVTAQSVEVLPLPEERDFFPGVASAIEADQKAFTLLPRPKGKPNGSGGGGGPRPGGRNSKPGGPAAEPLRVLTSADTVIVSKASRDAAEVPAEFTALADGSGVAVHGTLDPAAKTITATKLEIRLAPAP